MKTSRRNFITKTTLSSLGILFGVESMSAKTPSVVMPLKTANLSTKSKSKRDLMLEVMDMSSKPNYVPAGFFRHFDLQGDEAVKAHLDYFNATGMDFVKIQFDKLGLPRNNEIKTPKDWTKMPVLTEEWFEPILYISRKLVKEAKSEAMIFQTLYSPYQMAKQAVPWELLVKHVYEDPESVKRGMENITLSIMNFVRASAKAGIDGFYMCSQGGEVNRIADEALFNKCIKNYDMLLFKEAKERVSHNITHICDYDGSYNNFESRFSDYPGQIINVPLSADNESLPLFKAAEIFKRPIMGGIDRHGVINSGSPEQVREATLKVLNKAPDNFILGADCTVSPKTPMINLQTAIKTAHEFRS